MTHHSHTYVAARDHQRSQRNASEHSLSLAGYFLSIQLQPIAGEGVDRKRMEILGEKMLSSLYIFVHVRMKQNVAYLYILSSYSTTHKMT